MSDNKKLYRNWKNMVLPKVRTGQIKINELVRDLKIDLKEYQPFILEETNYLDEDASWNERLYHLCYGLNHKPTCEICGNKVRYKSFNQGYLTYCSKKCGGKAKGPKMLSDESRRQLSESIKKVHQERGNEIVETREKTYKNRTGYRHQMHNPEVVSKLRKTMVNRYDSEFPLQNAKILNKFKNTNKEKYGYESCLLNDEIIKKSTITRIENYGETHWSKSENGRRYLRELGLERHKNRINKILQSKNLSFDDSVNYQNASYPHIWKCNVCGKRFKIPWCDIRDGYSCPYCYPKYIICSRHESEISEYLESFGLHIERNSRRLIPPKEIDIYIPKHDIGIEFDGLYWHSECMIIDKNYHLNKTLECEKQGIQLIHIFEDEWLNSKDIVKERLKQMLNLTNDKPKIFARNCTTKEITTKEKNQFLDKFHLQGRDRSKIKLGAFYNDTLISVMTFSKSNISRSFNSTNKNEWELSRFSINYNYQLPGIAGKLLEHFKRNYKWKSIDTFADRRWSNGNLYKKLGFIHLYNTGPNYWYINGMNRIHRFTLRKTENDLKDVPEWILRLWEGYDRIWDCGHMKFKIENY